MSTGGASAPPASPRRSSARRPRSAAMLALLLAIGLTVFSGFIALGVWQVHRLSWKLALIERVDARIHAAPVAAPGPGEWPQVSRERDEYLRVRVEGRYAGRNTLVQAVSDLGGGYWVMTPLVTQRGFTVLVNRGFVTPDQAPGFADRPASGEAGVVGLLRITEPRGGFLRSNDPAAGRWYSRDVAAIAARQHLRNVAPYFIDAGREGGAAAAGAPVPGLTVVRFPNNHLVYALTWFALAALTAGALALLLRDEYVLRRKEHA